MHDLELIVAANEHNLRACVLNMLEPLELSHDLF